MGGLSKGPRRLLSIESKDGFQAVRHRVQPVPGCAAARRSVVLFLHPDHPCFVAPLRKGPLHPSFGLDHAVPFELASGPRLARSPSWRGTI